MTRLSRKRVPMMFLLVMSCFAMIALYAKGTTSFSRLFFDSFDLFAYDLRMGWGWQTLQAGVLTIGVAAAGSALLIGGNYARATLAFLERPKISMRKTMKKSFHLMLCLAALSSVCMVGMRPLNAMVDKDLRDRGIALHAVFEFNQLHRSTLERLANEENSGHWWVDPEDGPVTRDIKLSFVRTNAWGRRTLHDLLNSRVGHSWENKYATE